MEVVSVGICCVVIIAAVFLYYTKCRGGGKGLMRLSEEHVVISGCDSGIGFYCAQLYDQLGFRVIAGCLSAEGEGAKRLASQTSSRLTVVQLDVTSEQSVTQLYDTVRRQVGDTGLWGLVNNAGVLCYGRLEWLTWRQCEQQVQVNLLGTIRLTKALLPLIKLRKGRILTMSSVNGVIAYPFQAVYCASKFGLEGLCDGLRLEVERYGVRVCALRLGDFSRLTSIMSSHEAHVQEMWSQMSEETRREGGEDFRRFNALVQQRHGMTSPVSYDHSQLKPDLVHFVQAHRPSPSYLCMSLPQRCLFTLLMLLPHSITHALVSYVFAKAFKWRSHH